MAEEPGKLKVVLAPRALRDLDEIWSWTSGRHGVDQAEAYVHFLLDGADALSHLHSLGRPVPGRPQYRYMVMKFRSRSSAHGHVMVFSVGDERVTVLTFVHTARKWQGLDYEDPAI